MLRRDGSHSYAVMKRPLPDNHWLTQPGLNVPPMPFRLGLYQFVAITTKHRTGYFTREEVAEHIHQAGRYAVRCATLNGQEKDFDPDALVQNFIVGLLGYWTPTGLSADDWANPTKERTT